MGLFISGIIFGIIVVLAIIFRKSITIPLGKWIWNKNGWLWDKITGSKVNNETDKTSN